MISIGNALNILGQRGFIPNADLINVAFELIDRRDGQGIQLRMWNPSYGEVPSEQEWALAETPAILLTLQLTEDGFLATARTLNAPTCHWRIIDPYGEIHEDVAPMVGGESKWEVETFTLGEYRVAVWQTGFGYAEEVFYAE